MDDSKRDEESDAKADAIRTLMRDQLGVVDPNKLLRLTFYRGWRTAFVDMWPVGIDARAADRFVELLGIKILHLTNISPYGSAYVIDPLPPGVSLEHG